jgi:hypothetical protein
MSADAAVMTLSFPLGKETAAWKSGRFHWVIMTLS